MFAWRLGTLARWRSPVGGFSLQLQPSGERLFQTTAPRLKEEAPPDPKVSRKVDEAMAWLEALEADPDVGATFDANPEEEAMMEHFDPWDDKTFSRARTSTSAWSEEAEEAAPSSGRSSGPRTGRPASSAKTSGLGASEAKQDQTRARAAPSQQFSEEYYDPHEPPERQEERLKLEQLAKSHHRETAIRAALALGEGHFQKRWGTDPHRLQAERWFKRAAALKDPLALRIVGLRFEHKREHGKALIREAAELGDVPAMEMIAEDCLRTGQGNTAAIWNYRAAEAGSAKGAYNLYVMLTRGIGVNPQAKRAQKYLEVAAQRGLPEALWQLGQQQNDVTQIEAAAAGGLVKAQLYMAKHLLKQGDKPAAARWYEQAAQGGSLEAKYLLAVHFMRNELRPSPQAPVQDPIQAAADLLMEASVNGHRPSQQLMKAFSVTDPHYDVHGLNKKPKWRS
jgi:TPR repeat protein